MEAYQAVLNGQRYLQCRRTVLLVFSPGNPHYYRLEALERLFNLGKRSTEKVLLFIPDKIAEHNHRAVGSKTPEKSARVKAKRLRNKCKEAIQSSGLSETSYSYVKWMEEVETCRKYEDALQDIKDLYQVNDEFRAETRDATEAALRRLKNSRENGDGNKENGASESTPDLEEGVNYLLKELAFFVAVPNIYESCEEFVVVYHRSWPVLEKFFSGCYDGVVRPCLGFVVFE